MAKARVPYPAEFRQKIVELHRAGRSILELPEQFEPSEQTIRNWVVSPTRNRPPKRVNSKRVNC